MIRRILSQFKIRRDERWVALLALLLFGTLVSIMVAYTTGWGNPDVLKVGVVVSGFDNMVYTTIRQWHIGYSIMRHPLLSLLLMPLSWLDHGLAWLTGEECNAYIVGVLWVVLDLYSFIFLYRTLHRAMEMRKADSLVLTLLFFSLAFVMLAAMVPDHMCISMFLLSATLYIAAVRIRKHRVLRARWSLWLFFLSTGITTTNGIKIVLADFVTIISKQWHYLRTQRRERSGYRPLMDIAGLTRHFLLYLIPAALLFGIYVAQDELIVKPVAAERHELMKKKMAKSKDFATRMKKRSDAEKKFRNKQVIKGKLFEFTDGTVSRMPTLIDNVFGEGLQLHRTHLLDDPHGKEPHRRPQFVSYERYEQDVIEVILVVLLVAGIIAGITNPVMWIALSWFLLDMTIHVGFKFAINDVFIMTAHWALLFPIAYACLLRRTQRLPWLHNTLTVVMALLAVYLFAYNGSLAIGYLI